MIASRRAVELIARRESFRATAYQDSGGVWTIGFGTTKGVKQGDRITPEVALTRLMEDIASSEKSILSTVTSDLSQYQFDALVSFVYNVGSGAFARSTMRRKINVDDMEGAAREFSRWTFAGGKKLSGLVSRRAEEEKLFRQAVSA
jgi:lysozyme